MRPKLREPGLETLRLYLESNCPGLDASEALRATIDAIQIGIGQHILNGLFRTRAYHAKMGPLDKTDLLQAGDVMKLVRKECGMDDEPGMPVERETRKKKR